MQSISTSRFLAALAPLVLLLPIQTAAAPPAEPLASFATEKEAQERCPGAPVVWLDQPSKVYYYRGQQKYGSTQHGAYVCRDDAKRAGMKEARSTQ